MRPGDKRLKAAVARQKKRARKDQPIPYDDDWGWWIEQRLNHLEGNIKWLVGLAATTLAAEVLRILTSTWH
jgi:hypothetical protein